MAKKKQPPTTAAAAKDDEPLTPASKKDQPPPSKKPEEDKVEEKDDEDSTSEEASSSEGEESDDGSSEDDDDEEQQKTPSSQPASKTAPSAKSGSKKDEEEEDDDEETDSDSDHEPPPKLKSINSKSIDRTLKSKPEPKSTATPARSGTKRSAEDDTKQSKKKKTTVTSDNAKEKEKEKEEDNKKPGDDSKKLFQRVFNEDDEVAILQGLVEFTAKPGNDPVKYPTAFYQHVKDSIHFPVTLEQLKDKVRRLKGKFETKMKNCKSGKPPTFSKPIEEKMFEYGKKIWGGKIGEENGKTDEKPSKKGAAKKSPTTKKLVMEPDLLVVSNETRKENPGSSYILNEMDRFDKSLSGVFGSSMDLMKSGLELLEESKRVELETRWKELRFAELKLVAMRAELAVDQGRLILDEFKSSSSH
ncbi:hypothetical protein TSUD_411370 [Trifolium subterraneum]|uniref:Glabrous enhancer-binding protein-like DBD domain-containing protein n=1 Tax=Trifolium subterraneum TaxID=3900 RepID=A0A2Z6P3C8_TRISU|nr:hypothetical protein TSUD_411370 [Trifolium subterraneum]